MGTLPAPFPVLCSLRAVNGTPGHGDTAGGSLGSGTRSPQQGVKPWQGDASHRQGRGLFWGF